MTASTAFTRSRASATLSPLRSRSRHARRGDAWDLRHMSRLRAQFSRREPWALRFLRTLLEDRAKTAASPSFKQRERLTA